jgi:hypothetical protein
VDSRKIKATGGLIGSVVFALFSGFLTIYFWLISSVPDYESLRLREGIVLQLFKEEDYSKYGCGFCGVLLVFSADRNSYFYDNDGGEIDQVFENLSEAFEKKRTVGVRFDPRTASEEEGRRKFEVYEILVDGQVIKGYPGIARGWRGRNLSWSGASLLIATFGLFCVYAEIREQRRGPNRMAARPVAPVKPVPEWWKTFWRRSRLEKVFGPWSRWDNGPD